MKPKKLLVISSLVLLFNLYWAPLLGAPPNSVSKKPANELAVFRLSGQVFFKSDLKNTKKALKVLECLSSQSLLKKYLNVELSQLQKASLEQLLSSDDFHTDGRVLAFIEIERLKNAVLGRGKELLSKAELLALGKKCERLTWSRVSIEEKALLLAEVYLRDRFLKSQNTASALAELKKGLQVKEKHEFFKFRPSENLKGKYRDHLNKSETKREKVKEATGPVSPSS